MSKKSLEQTIKEYFDQYGAILVGMHQDLQSQQATVDRKLVDAEERSVASLAAFNEKADGIVILVRDSEAKLAQSVREFNRRSKVVVAEVVSSSEGLIKSIHQSEADHQQRQALLNSQVGAAIATAKAHVDGLKEETNKQIEVFEANLTVAKGEFAKAIADTSKSFTDHVSQSRMTLAAEIEKVRGQMKETVERHRQMVTTALDEYRTTNAAQHRWFEEHSALLAAQSEETIARLQALDEKTTAHQIREAAFNKRLRQIAVGILAVVAISVLTVVLIWKP